MRGIGVLCVVALFLPAPLRGGLCEENVIADFIELRFLPEPDDVLDFLRTRDWTATPNPFSPRDWRFFLAPPPIPLLHGQMTLFRSYGDGRYAPNGPNGEVYSVRRDMVIDRIRHPYQLVAFDEDDRRNLAICIWPRRDHATASPATDALVTYIRDAGGVDYELRRFVDSPRPSEWTTEESYVGDDGLVYYHPIALVFDRGNPAAWRVARRTLFDGMSPR